MYISEITQNGEVIVQFSEELWSIDQQKGLNLTMISNKVLFGVDFKTFIDDDDLLDGEENVPELLCWGITQFESKYMKFKLDLSNPLMVSTGEERDQLEIHFKFPSLFKSI